MVASALPAPKEDPVVTAKAAGLRHVSDRAPGLRRAKRGKSFFYLDPAGARVLDDAQLARIRSLAIPPAWTDVWICVDARGHIQATGRDAKGRKQYRYHPDFRAARDETKYARLASFARALPTIRAAVERDLARRDLCREKVLATIVRLLELTRARVGNEEYARQNGSYGLTTLQDQHAEVSSTAVKLSFRGKSGVDHELLVKSKKLASIVKRCQELPGEELFRYVDEHGQSRPIESGDVNDYLRAITGQDFTAKDFRTWAGTIEAARCLLGEGPCPQTKTGVNKRIVDAVKRTAALLNNRPATCKKFYVHPAIVEAFRQGTLTAAFEPGAVVGDAPAGLAPEERAVLHLLETTRPTAPAREPKAPRSLTKLLQRSRAAAKKKKPRRAA